MKLVRQGAEGLGSENHGELTEISSDKQTQGAIGSNESTDEPGSSTTEEAEVVEPNVSATHTQQPTDQPSDLMVIQTN